MKSLKNKKKKMALTQFCNASPEVWLGNSRKLVSTDQLKFYNFSHPQELKNDITPKYSSFFNNTPPAN